MNEDQNTPTPKSTNQTAAQHTDETLANVLREYASPEQQEREVQNIIEREEQALRDALGHLPGQQQQEQATSAVCEQLPQQQQHEQIAKPKSAVFPCPLMGTPIPAVFEPRDLREDADEQRGVLVDEFFAFILEQRHQSEFRVWSLTRRLRELQPFLEARIDESEREVDLERPVTDPHRQRVLVAPAVYEYGVAAAALGQAQSQLDLLNTYYFDAMENRSDFYIDIIPANQRDVRQLWQWFLDERESEDESIAGGAA